MLHSAGLRKPVLDRWLLAYWCFYHAGTASRIAEALDFWDAMRDADEGNAPRGTERRHFRAAASKAAIDFLAERYANPSEAIMAVTAPTFAAVERRVMAWPMFGPWVAWKVADMLERVAGVRVDFSDTSLRLYREPAEGAALVAKEHSVPDDPAVVVEWILHGLNHRPAPPDWKRPINIQEAETILCKYKAHSRGHYPVGKDTAEIREGLSGAGPLADYLALGLPSKAGLLA
jgi:hypothetical protein